MSNSLSQELRSCWENEHFSFHMPGHKGGRNLPDLAYEMIGATAFRADVSEIGGFDYLHAPQGNLRRAQEFAATVFGAKHSFFLINGTTAGNLASLLATVNDNDRVLVSRMSHRSTFAGIALTGAIPEYVYTHEMVDNDTYWNRDHNADGLMKRVTESNIKAIHVTNPNYYGLSADIKTFLDIAAKANIPLIVDEAHGAHFAFHPAFPPTALSQNADISIQSIHKTLGSLTQSSILHLGSQLVDAYRIEQALRIVQSSSPSALLLLSLDLVCSHINSKGFVLFEDLLGLVSFARQEIGNIDGLYCYGDEICSSSKVKYYDPTKLIIDITRLKITGFDAANWLKEFHAIGVELSDFNRIVCTITIADSTESIGQLLTALRNLAKRFLIKSTRHNKVPNFDQLPRIAPSALTLRKALQVPTILLGFRNAIGKISAEFIVVYPPGIPIIVPGEIITQESADYLLRFKSFGGIIKGLLDPYLQKIRVVRE